jgi:transcriptional regulator with XRE-family HTH domain
MSKKVQKNIIDWYIVNKVRDMRQERNISQESLAAHLNVSNGFIGQVESPNYRAKYKTLHLNELAKLFNCSPKDFWPEKSL